MKILKLCVIKTGAGCQAIKTYNPFPCDLTIDAEEAPTSNPRCWDIVDGSIVEALELNTQLEVAEREIELKPQALKYQSDRQSPNELALLHGYAPADMDDHPLAAEQIEWMDSLFDLYKEKLDGRELEISFSSIGEKPHSFKQLYMEKWS